MNTRSSKSALLYEEIRLALQTGRYAPGDRIDPATLASEFRTSPTPVRCALYRLVGEGVIADHAREGFHVPLFTELELRDLYDWMQRLLMMACGIRVKPSASTRDVIDTPFEEGDLVTSTRRLFDHIALASEHLSLIRAVQQANDRLGPVRMAKLGLIEDARAELAALHSLWRRRHFDALDLALTEYHERRKRLVPRIVAMLSRSARYTSH